MRCSLVVALSLLILTITIKQTYAEVETGEGKRVIEEVELSKEAEKQDIIEERNTEVEKQDFIEVRGAGLDKENGDTELDKERGTESIREKAEPNNREKSESNESSYENRENIDAGESSGENRENIDAGESPYENKESIDAGESPYENKESIDAGESPDENSAHEGSGDINSESAGQAIESSDGVVSPIASDLDSQNSDLLQTEDTIGEGQELLAEEKPKRRGFFRKIGDYFKNSNEDKTHAKKFDFSIIGGPHYSSDVKLGLGLVAAGLFRTGSSPTFKQPSNVSIYGDITTSGFWALGVRGNTIFKEGKHRLDYVAAFSHMPTNFWGLGYDMGKNNSNKTSFDQDQVHLRIDYMIRIAKNLYLGTNFSFNHTKVSDFGSTAIILDQRRKYTNTGLGFFLLYDSRDAYTAAHSGWFFKIENIDFPKFLGNKMEFNSSELTLNFYHPIWKGAVMAYDLHGVYKDGEAPWTMLARMGGSNRMRGYYEGRYRDKGLLEIQAELRQRIWRRIGVTAWVGAGNVFHEFPKINMSHTLYNYGVGLRWEFKKRVNVRLDYGFGKGESSFIFSINEAF